MTVVGSIIISILLFVVGLVSVRSSRTVAKVFMFIAIGWIFLTSFAVPPVEEQHGCLVTYSYDTPMAIIVSVVFWSMLAIMIVIRIWRVILSRKTFNGVDGKNGGETEPQEK